MERVIELQGCLNFRDLGGYPTRAGRKLRWRQLFRSDGLHHLTAADVAFLRDELRIDEVIDLRSTAEVRTDGVGPLGGEPIRRHHLPLFDSDVVQQSQPDSVRTLADRYFLLAEFAREAIAQVVETLASASGPAVYHCAAGKDRISAVLLGVLEVPDEIVVADYAATQQNLDAIIERLMSTKGYETMLSALPPDTLHAQPETMISLLERIGDTYGSMREYVLSIGVSPESIERLEERLLD